MALPRQRSNFNAKSLAPWLLTLSLAIQALWPTRTFAITANQVWFEFHPNFYRVVFSYTLPRLKEWREGYVEFRSRKKAEAFYWRLVRGADFQLGDPEDFRFTTTPPQADPW